MYFKIMAGLVVMTIIIGCAGSKVQWNKIDTPTDPNYLYATGTAESKDLQLAIDKATLNARTEISRQMEIKLNTLQKSFAEEIGNENTETNQLYTTVTKAVVSEQLMGSKVKDTKYRQENGKYQAVVLVEYPIGEANVALVNQIQKNKNLYTQFRASEGFKELESEVEKYEKKKNQ